MAPTGVKNLLEEEAIRVGGSNHSHATQDLYDSIAKGEYPEWTLYIQTLDPADQHRCSLCARMAVPLLVLCCWRCCCQLLPAPAATATAAAPLSTLPAHLASAVPQVRL